MEEIKGEYFLAMTKREKVEKNLLYIKEQMKLFIWENFKDKPVIIIYANKELTKKRKYGKTTFGKSVHEPIEVDIEYTLLVNGKKQKMLETAFREALRIGLMRSKRPYQDGNPRFENELRKHNLPSYGGVAEMGAELHVYECSGCKKVWALKEKKLPKSKDPEHLGYVTECCKTPFRYGGKKNYDNDTLQRVKQNYGK